MGETAYGTVSPLTSITIGIGMATLGAPRVHTVAVTEEGGVLAAAMVPLPAPLHDRTGRGEHDPRTWWPAVERALCQVTADLPRAEIGAVAVTATAGTIVPVNRRGLPAGPALLPDDRRGAEFNRRAAELGARRWQALGLDVPPTAALGRLAWLATNAREAAGIRHVPEVIGTQLTGKRVAVDSAHALGTGYDPLAGEWACEVLDALNVPRKWLPAVVPPATVLGTVSRTSAALTGLPKGCPVVAGMTSDCAGAIAAGAVSPGRFATRLDRMYVLKGVTATLVPDPGGLVHSHRFPIDWWMPGAVASTGGEALPDIARLDAAAADRGPAELVVYRKPFDTKETREFTSAEPADEVELHRARLEGAAFVEKLVLDHLRRLGIAPVEPLLATGPATESLLWTQIRATATGLAIRLASHGEPAYGAAVLAAAGARKGALRVDSSGTLVEPVAAEQDALSASYHRFCSELHERGWIDDELHAVTTT
ncbi:FGGY family carbohydrate kinase [Amycolatopsis sp. 195334CR]|uniref:FGGY family carbohydrate kinase n=1 Tax=Amycolatopsis sp. 195334CR TaxID=2814588 RepID=UPI001F5D0C39|nr:FGGY family carbohydrate kinase [Amycolatopsis sp. 195334CR]